MSRRETQNKITHRLTLMPLTMHWLTLYQAADIMVSSVFASANA
jgi:hypothetical protein